ncbi:MAG: O-antigen ligase family protein [Elusimicrobia bacterium]|nr:O-antigen ligase family protein [Elusimicrobiota bacterium]
MMVKNSRTEKYFVPVLLFLVCTAFSPYFTDAFYGIKTVISAVLLAGLIYFYGIGRFISSRFRIPAILLAVSGLAGLTARGDYAFIGGNYAGMVMLLLIAGILSGTETGPEPAARVRLSVVAALFVISVYSIFQYYGIAPEIERFRGTPLPYSTLGHRNYVADFAVLAVPFLFGGIRKKNPLYILGLVLAVWTILLAGSMRAYAGMLAVTGVYFISMRIRSGRKRYTLLLGAAVLSTGLYVAGKIPVLYRVNLKPRLLIWKVAYGMFRDSPVMGQGTGTFEYRYPEYQYAFFRDPDNEKYAEYGSDPQRANNEYLHVLSEQGVLGLALYIWIFWLWFKYKKGKDEEFALPAVCGISGILVTSFFGYPFHRPSISAVIAVIMGLTMEPVRDFRPTRLSRLFDMVLFSLCLMIALLRTGEQVYSEKAEKAFLESDFALAQKYSSSALGFSVLPGKIYFLRGRISYRQGDYDSALENYALASETYRNSALYYNRGLVYMRMKNLDMAELNLVRAVSVNPGFRRARRLLMELYRFKKLEK